MADRILDLAQSMFDWEEGKLDEDQTIELFQELVNTGWAWRLQGFYGRTAVALLEAGHITAPEPKS